MQTITFSKLEALGNDFVLIDTTNQVDINLTVEQIKQICDRHYGIGCDQLLIIKQINRNQIPCFSYKIYNIDGSQALHCGNGARAVICYIKHKYRFESKYIELVLANNHVITGQITTNELIKIDMGAVKFTPQSLPAILTQSTTNNYTIKYQSQIINYGIASVGNPHVIIKLANNLFNDDNYIIEVGRTIQSKIDIFPEGVNVNFIYIQNPYTIMLKTYERGSGLTKACGSGATASASYCYHYQQCNNNIQVIMQGGSLQVTIENNNCQLIGNANIVFNGNIIL